MSKRRDQEVSKLILQSKEKIKSTIPKETLAINHSIQEKTVAKYQAEIGLFMPFLISYYEELLPYPKALKSLITDITEETHMCGIYLLLCHTFDAWKSFFHLIEGGYSTAAGIQLRNIQEADMLISLFMVEHVEKENIHLQEWFSGKIISHGKGRKRVGAFYKKVDESMDSIEEMASYIHEIESLGAHNAYISVLQLVSPFTEDFDFNGYTQIYRCLSEVRHAIGIMSQTNITLKSIYGFLPDKTKYTELDNILKKYSPEVTGEAGGNFLADFKWQK